MGMYRYGVLKMAAARNVCSVVSSASSAYVGLRIFVDLRLRVR